MNITKFYLKHLGVVFLATVTAAIGIFAFAGGSLLSHYCTPNAALFLGQNVSANPACSLIVAASLILLCSIVFAVLILLVTSLLDISKFIGVKAWSGIKYYFIRTRPANFLITNIRLKNEIYLIVHNDEFWLRANEVCALTEYVYRDLNSPVREYIKWDKQDIGNIETSISRKAHKLLHFATINSKENTFSVHRTKGDETFPFPEKEHSYKFPLYVKGSMVFLHKAPRVLLNTHRLIIVDYKEKDDITVKVEGNVVKYEYKSQPLTKSHPYP